MQLRRIARLARVPALAVALALGLGFTAFSSPAHAQSQVRFEFPIVSLYDLDATTPTYFVTTGQRGDPLSPSIPGRGKVTVSSTTVTAADASLDVFANIAAGDEIGFNNAGKMEWRVVTTHTSDDAVVISAALSANITTAQAFVWRERVSGTASTSAWFPVSSFDTMTVLIGVSQIVVTGHIDFKVQCRGSGSDNPPIEVYSPLTSNYRSGGYDAAQVDNDAIGVDLRLIQAAECRVGMYIDSADDGGDATTNAEQVTVKVVLGGMR